MEWGVISKAGGLKIMSGTVTVPNKTTTLIDLGGRPRLVILNHSPIVMSTTTFSYNTNGLNSTLTFTENGLSIYSNRIDGETSATFKYVVFV